MGLQSGVGSTKVPIALHFQTTDIADANGTLNSIVAAVDEYVMPVSGSIVGFGVQLNGTLTTGTLTFAPTKNGVALSDSFSDSPLTVDSAYGTIEAQKIGWSFVAGDSVGLMWTKAGTVAPTTRDGAALVFVLLDPYNY